MSLKSSIPLWLRAPRSSLFLLIAAALLAVIAMVSPGSGQCADPSDLDYGHPWSTS